VETTKEKENENENENDLLHYGTMRLHGNINDFLLDPNGKRLIVLFQKNEKHSDSKGMESQIYHQIALFSVLRSLKKKTANAPQIRFLFRPIGFIKNHSFGVFPLLARFVPHYDFGSLLSVLWSDGKIIFYPFLYRMSE